MMEIEDFLDEKEVSFYNSIQVENKDDRTIYDSEQDYDRALALSFDGHPISKTGDGCNNNRLEDGVTGRIF